MANKVFNKIRAEYLLEIAKKIYEIDPLAKERYQMAVFARTAISIQLLQDAESYSHIENFLGKSKETIIHGVRKHLDSMKYDKVYQSLYNKFVLEICAPANLKQLRFRETKDQVNRINITLIEMSFTHTEIIDFWNECITESMVQNQESINY